MYGHGHMQHVPAMHAPPSVLAPPVPSADMLQRLKADLMKQEKQVRPCWLLAAGCWLLAAGCWLLLLATAACCC
jgi:hypothetical protein